jgi:hypothetical protein
MAGGPALLVDRCSLGGWVAPLSSGKPPADGYRAQCGDRMFGSADEVAGGGVGAS